MPPSRPIPWSDGTRCKRNVPKGSTKDSQRFRVRSRVISVINLPGNFAYSVGCWVATEVPFQPVLGAKICRSRCASMVSSFRFS